MTQASPALEGAAKRDADRAGRLAFVALVAGAALLAWLLLAEALALHQIVCGLVVLYGIFLAHHGSRPARPRD